MNYITMTDTLEEKTKNAEKDYPNISFDVLFPRKFRTKIRFKVNDFLLLFPNSFFYMENNVHLTELKASRISKYWNAYDADSQADAGRVKDNILNAAQSGNYSFFTLPENCELQKNVESFLNGLSGDVLQNYRNDVEKLIERFLSGIKNGQKKYRGFRDRHLDIAFENDLLSFPSRLSCLMLIAATWFYWNRNANANPIPEDQKAVRDLSLIIFPFHPDAGGSHLSAEEAEDMRKSEIAREKEAARKKLEKAWEQFHSGNYHDCGEECRSIIAMGYAEPSVQGDAYYLLVECREKHHYRYVGHYDAPRFLRRAIDLGCEKARKSWETLHLNSLLYCPKPSSSAPVRLVFNVSSNNPFALSILRTLPEKMRNMTAERRSNYLFHICSGDPSMDHYALNQTISPGIHTKYLLLDNDYDKNFHDLLYILNGIKTWKAEGQTAPDADPWKGTEIYLRTNEENYSALIDTAVRHMDGIVLPVYVIDDAKWPAQYLLSRHPFFYSIRSARKRSLNNNSHMINLNILSINDDLANWLIREAYWMSCFTYKKLTVTINVFSPDAEQIESRLRFECGGMWKELPDSDVTSKVNLRFLPNCSLQSPQLTAVLNKHCFQPYADDYFIINAGDDIASMKLGIKLREMSITNTIHSGSSADKVALPVIAYKCTDPDYAHLAENMVVQMEAHGDSWYNNYALIPFGTLTDRYSFDGLSGGYFEKLAQAVHLQYCGVLSEQSTEQDVSEALASYFSRCYNRDSSMAVALSLPYRLFQTSADSEREHYEHIVPTGWDIMNPFTYTEELSIEEIKSAFSKRNNNEELFLYEHSRWVRWIVSRGWSSASPEEAIRFMDAGNPKHQLYISRLHACLCSIEQLTELSKAMADHYTQTGDKRFVDFLSAKSKAPKDFTRIDKSNIDQTADILSAARPSEKEEQINNSEEWDR